jgi:beta-barrel assembly-enhancing protease
MKTIRENRRDIATILRALRCSGSILLLLVVALAVPPAATAEAGQYGPQAIRTDERHLLASANELEGYFAAHGLLYKDEQVLTLVRRVGQSIQPQATDDYEVYEFRVLRDPSPNAFALPNGSVYVHTGMLARLNDEDQLAALLAHETTHVAGHHALVVHREQKKATIAVMVVGPFALGKEASVYGFSRDLELEADDHAAATMRDSRYDPHALPELLDILGRDYDGVDPRLATIWSTHPEIRARALASRARVADMPQRERTVDGFEDVVFGLRVLTVQDYIRDDYPQTALALAEDLVARHPNDARMLLLVGDAWQGMGAQTRIDSERLTNSEKKRNQRDHARKTREQRFAALLATDEGRMAYAENLARAEDAYRHAIAIDSSLAAAHRGLAEVFEQQKLPREAALEYLTYVRSAPDAADRPIVVGRLNALTAKLKENPQ